MNLIVLKCAACEHISCDYDENNVFKVKYYVSYLYFSYFIYIQLNNSYLAASKYL